jgi:hypothetical protein
MKGITMTFKSAAKSFGSGLLTTATVLHNSPINTRIAEIDEQMEKLQEEKTRLEADLIKY